MDGRFFRSFAEAEMGVIQANSSKNSSNFKGAPDRTRTYTA